MSPYYQFWLSRRSLSNPFLRAPLQWTKKSARGLGHPRKGRLPQVEEERETETGVGRNWCGCRRCRACVRRSLGLAGGPYAPLGRCSSLLGCCRSSPHVLEGNLFFHVFFLPLPWFRSSQTLSVVPWRF